MRIAYNEATCRERSSLEMDLMLCRENGITEIELRFDMISRYLEQNGYEALKSLIVSSGVKPITLNAIFDINFLNEAQRRSIEQQLRHACDIGRLLNVDCVIVLPTACENVEQYTWEEIHRDSVANLIWMAEIGKESGMRIAFEPIGASERCVRSIKEAWEIVRDVNRGDVGLALDVYNLYLYQALNDVNDLLLVDPQKIFVVHIDDADPGTSVRLLGTFDRVLPGDGSIDLESFLSTLMRIGYEGACSIEVLNKKYWKRDPRDLFVEALDKTKRIMNKVERNELQ